MFLLSNLEIELQRRDQLKEEAAIPSDDIDIDIQNEEEEKDLLNLQDELDQIELQLAQCEEESNLLDQELQGRVNQLNK